MEDAISLLELAKLMENKFYLKGFIGTYVNTNIPRDGSDKWKMLTFSVNQGSGKYTQKHNIIAWDNKKLGTTLATDYADLTPGELVLVSGERCDNNEYKNKQGDLIHTPQFTVLTITRLGGATAPPTDPAPQGVDLDDNTIDETFL